MLRIQMPKLNKQLSGVPETLLIPLYYRANETQRSDAIIRDPKAVEIVAQLDYDFADFNQWYTQVCVAVRTLLFRQAISSYIKKNPNCTVINFAAGLDNRFEEVDNGSISWYDLDLPEVIKLRKQFISESARRKFIAADLFDGSWIDQLTDRDRSEPTLFIAEGLLPYFTEDQVRNLFTTSASQFQTSTIIFEIFGWIFVGREIVIRELRHIKPTPRFTWSPRNPDVIESWRPSFHIKSIANIFDYRSDRWKYMKYLAENSAYFRDLAGNKVITLQLNE